ncbi:DEAD/DEAH box helicase [Cupriavidus basilensis]
MQIPGSAACGATVSGGDGKFPCRRLCLRTTPHRTSAAVDVEGTRSGAPGPKHGQRSRPGDCVHRFPGGCLVAAARTPVRKCFAPTSAGKSFLVQMYLLDELANTQTTRNIVYLVPSRSLIFECRPASHTRLKPLADRVVVSSVPQVNDDLHAGKSLVFVLTQERLQTILNESTIEFDVVIVDEAQQIGDADRGILLLGCLEDALARHPESKMLFITPSSKDARTNRTVARGDGGADGSECRSTRTARTCCS